MSDIVDSVTKHLADYLLEHTGLAVYYRTNRIIIYKENANTWVATVDVSIADVTVYLPNSSIGLSHRSVILPLADPELYTKVAKAIIDNTVITEE